LITPSFSANLGDTTQVTANTVTNIQYGVALLGPALQIELNMNGNVTLQAYVNLQTTLPSGCQNLSFGLDIGYQLIISPPNAVVISATLTTPALAASAIALITLNTNLWFFQYNSTTQFYSAIAVNYNGITQVVTVPLPSAGIYVLVVLDITAPIPTFFDQPRDLSAQSNVSLSFPDGLSLSVNVQSDTTLTTTFLTTNPHNNPGNGSTSINAFFDFNTTSNVTLNATIYYQYSVQTVNQIGVDATTLKIAFYDEQSGQWVFPSSGGSVSTSTMVVSQTTTHFSTWGVFGHSTSSTQGTTGANSAFTTSALISLIGFNLFLI